MKEDLQTKALILNNIHKYRLEKNLSQVELSKALCITRTYLSKLENRKFSPSVDLMFKICRYFEVELGEMFYIHF